MPNKKNLITVAVILVAIARILATAVPAFAASKEKVLYSFKNNGTDGHYPLASLAFDAAGNLYGTTGLGGTPGSGCNGNGCGTVFQLESGEKGKWSEKVLYSFQDNGTDGFEPAAGLILDAQGSLYGTTVLGGVSDLDCGGAGCGTVFELSPGTDGGWTEEILYNFNPSYNGTDGSYPRASLIFDPTGNLYGTTSGGDHGSSTVFELMPSPDGWTESLLYVFGFYEYGGEPRAALIFDAAGNLYSTLSIAADRGGKAVGFVFKLTPDTGGGWTEKILYGCKIQGCPNNGSGAYGSVIFDKARNIYSTTYQGGAYGQGIVFQLTPQKGGKWTEQVLHSFGSGADGAQPQAGLVRDDAGNFYGTTYSGGTYGGGTVFRLTHKQGDWTYKVIYNFGKGKDGVNPYAGLIFDAAGNLYGTTSQGGTDDYGAVFEITP